jgi:DNA phosphorothioation system restriction enzyme
MSLKDIEIKIVYRSLIDKVAQDFYIPLLSQAILYRRAVGFFSSSSLIEISKGIASLVNNGGKIQLVASPYLSEEDVAAMKKGYEMRDQIIKSAIRREMRDAVDDLGKERLNLLANLISDGIMDIKIAFTEDESKMGMYHEKMGIISDFEGNKVAFAGSMNETQTAMTLNYESIDVFCSWRGDDDRIEEKETAFTAIWNDCEPNVRIIDFPELKQEIVEKYKKSIPDLEMDNKEYGSNLFFSHVDKKRCRAAIPANVSLHDYQVEAIANWQAQHYRGIFDMATGTGKTYTGLGAVAKLCEDVDNKLALIIVCPYQHLVEQWVEDIENFNMKPIIGYSASSQKDWKKRLENAVRDQKLKVSSKEFFCFICTNATFAADFVQTQIGKIRGDILLMVDEAHNFGATQLLSLLSERYTFRLALSATIDRHNDDEGTSALFNFFGVKCIEYTLDRAIEEGKLTRYKYFPIVTTLNDDELQRYSELTFEISKCILKGKNGKVKLSERGKILAMSRARLVAGATDKLEKLREYILPYTKDKHILVYCGATNILREGQDYSDFNDLDLRQIDAVTDMLGNQLDMKVSQFTSKEDVAERAILKREFAEGETLQVLIAIKCLDEGVNIPKIKVAFILASTTNPKEYIQRRGRVLRLSEGKDYAEIYDFIALPRPLNEVPSLTMEQLKRELSLVKNELARAEEFSRISMNMVESDAIIDEIKMAYAINDSLITFEEDFSYGG